MSDYTRIRREIQEAKHLTGSEKDELIRLIKGVNNMKRYELTIIFRDDVSEQEIGKIENSIILKHGSILKREDEGSKRLAYPIMGQDIGHYVFYKIALEDSEPAKLSSELNIKDEVLRYLLVRCDTRYDN